MPSLPRFSCTVTSTYFPDDAEWTMPAFPRPGSRSRRSARRAQRLGAPRTASTAGAAASAIFLVIAASAPGEGGAPEAPRHHQAHRVRAVLHHDQPPPANSSSGPNYPGVSPDPEGPARCDAGDDRSPRGGTGEFFASWICVAENVYPALILSMEGQLDAAAELEGQAVPGARGRQPTAARRCE